MQKMTALEAVTTLGELIKLGLVEAVHEAGQPVRYRLTGVPVDDEQESVEAVSVLQTAA